MRGGIAIVLLALACSMLLSSHPHLRNITGPRNGSKPKTDAELIASAMSAGPLAVSKDATVVAVGSDGKLRTLRQGQGAFTCVPDDPNAPGIDPMCMDRIWL